jgi:hypothetical protein
MISLWHICGSRSRQLSGAWARVARTPVGVIDAGLSAGMRIAALIHCGQGDAMGTGVSRRRQRRSGSVSGAKHPASTGGIGAGHAVSRRPGGTGSRRCSWRLAAMTASSCGAIMKA